MVDAYKNDLRKTNFEDFNPAYSDFFQKLITVIENVAPCKTKGVKGQNQNWSDGDALEKFRLTDKFFKTFKKTNLYIDKNYIERLITTH